MRLEQLRITSFKNLQDFSIDFDSREPYTVLVGGNGSGKSNLLEALTEIFGHLDLGSEAPFDYELRYRCRDSQLEVTGTQGRKAVVRAREITGGNFRRISQSEFMRVDQDERPLYRPAFVFGYYSGPSDRLAALYETHRHRYYDWIIRGEERRTKEIRDPNTLRRLFYAETLHGQFALIAFFMESQKRGGDDQDFLREYLHIDGLDSVLFALCRPPWAKLSGEEDPFWGAKGEVRTFLDRLRESALLPLRMNRRMSRTATNESVIENQYLFLPDVASLRAVYKKYRDQYAFFTALESTHLSLMLSEVRTRVRMTGAAGGGEFTYRDLSEGEQQLLLVLGLLKFTARDEALFLLDEPDTHLNPAWSIQYLSFLDRFIKQRASCHIVMSSHDPLVFSSLHREQVRLISRDRDGRAVAEPPLEDPIGMGISAILASDLFRLPSGGLDAVTLADLEEQRALAQRETKLSGADAKRLREITERLEARGFNYERRDPVEQIFREHFIPRWLARAVPGETEKPVLTKAELKAREQTAAEIADELAQELASEGTEP